MSFAVVIPARDEALALPGVLAALPAAGAELALAGGARARLVEIVVVDNGSRDATATAARAGGARVVVEPRAGYGSACLAGLASLAAAPPDVVVFLDADHSDDPRDLHAVLAPVAGDEAALAIGSRVLGRRESGAFTLAQAVGNRLAAFLLRMLWGAHVTDLGPFRAVRWTALERLRMRDRDYGWTVEMQARALSLGLRTIEVPVAYRRRRHGRSKIAGTLRGVVGAGTKILFTIARVRLGG